MKGMVRASRRKRHNIIQVHLSDDLIDKHCVDGEHSELIGEVIARVKLKHPISSKIWVADHPLLRDGSFIVFCYGYEVAGYTLEPEDEFLDCLEQCLLYVMENHHDYIRKLESQRDSWWRQAIWGRTTEG